MTKVIYYPVCFYDIEFALEGKKEIWDELYLLANQYYAGGMGFDDIKTKLLERYNDEAFVFAVVSKAKTEIYTQKRKDGTTILAIGLVLILSGFIITCFNFHSDRSVAFAMYGLTSLGIIVVFWGLYKIMG
jgi:hypothetical protein